MSVLKAAHQAITEKLTVNPMQTLDAICIKLYGLGELEYWLDGKEIAKAGGVQAYFSDSGAVDGKMLSHIFSRDFEVMDTDGGLIDDFCSFRHFGECNFKAFQEALESGLDADVIRAAIALGIPLDEAEDKYAGRFGSEIDLAYDAVDNQALLEGVPEAVASYFDYEAYGRDLAIEMSHHNGHYFNP